MTAERQEYVTQLTPEEIKNQKNDTTFSNTALDDYKSMFGMNPDSEQALELTSRFSMLKEQRDQEIVKLQGGSRDKINEIMSMNDLLVGEKETQCAVANAALFNQVNTYMDSCTVA